MARPLDPQKRALFLSTALRLFVAQGVENTSTADITRAAGTAAGTLFLYFSTRQQLLNELVIQIANQQTANINQHLDRSQPARQIFFTIWDCSIRWFLANLDAYRFIQQVRDTRWIEESVVQETNRLFEFYYLAIQTGLAEGSIQPYPPELIGGFLYQDIVAVMTLLLMQTDLAQQTHSIQQGFEIFWNGIHTD
jgi:AcrR family transcriptional regulator